MFHEPLLGNFAQREHSKGQQWAIYRVTVPQATSCDTFRENRHKETTPLPFRGRLFFKLGPAYAQLTNETVAVLLSGAERRARVPIRTRMEDSEEHENKLFSVLATVSSDLPCSTRYLNLDAGTRGYAVEMILSQL